VDYEKWLGGLAPHAPIRQYRHNDTAEDNADAHMKRQIMGREVVVAVTNGRLDFGTWERISQGQAEWLARESRRAAAEAGAGQDNRRVVGFSCDRSGRGLRHRWVAMRKHEQSVKDKAR
jgi:hypothetical protein